MSKNVPETKYLDPEILQRLGDLELIAREVVEGLRVGSHWPAWFYTEFAHHRQYVPGDPPVHRLAGVQNPTILQAYRRKHFDSTY